jgi:hypothetical protein
MQCENNTFEIQVLYHKRQRRRRGKALPILNFDVEISDKLHALATLLEAKHKKYATINMLIFWTPLRTSTSGNRICLEHKIEGPAVTEIVSIREFPPST